MLASIATITLLLNALQLNAAPINSSALSYDPDYDASKNYYGHEDVTPLSKEFNSTKIENKPFKYSYDPDYDASKNYYGHEDVTPLSKESNSTEVQNKGIAKQAEQSNTTFFDDHFMPDSVQNKRPSFAEKSHFNEPPPFDMNAETLNNTEHKKKYEDFFAVSNTTSVFDSSIQRKEVAFNASEVIFNSTYNS